LEKKESYKHALPHFQQPGQAYFVTWSLKDAVPKKALTRYTKQLEILGDAIFIGCGELYSPGLKSAIENRATRDAPPDLEKLRQQYYSLRKKYIKAYDDLLDAERNPTVNLSKPDNTKIIAEAIYYWEGKKLSNHAYSIMTNHIHWVFELLEKDAEGRPIYLQDILQSVKRHTANRINKAEGRVGSLWQKESFDTTIRDEKHLYYAIEYTLNNPVSAGLVKDRKDWPGSWSGCGDF
jgi:REP element-mobilizing transposase RayT